MSKWIMVALTLNLFSAAYAADADATCRKLGIDDIQECVLSSSQGNTDKVYGITNMPYALCSKATCKPMKHVTFAECECELENYKKGWKSFSVSPGRYVSAKPTYNDDGSLQTVQSNHSMANISDFSERPAQLCQYGTPHRWANCYGVRCQVKNQIADGKVRQIAVCVCPVYANKLFLIGATEKSACARHDIIWSATIGDGSPVYGQKPLFIFYNKIYPQSPPAKTIK
ncbi:hypothetical protein [Legionella spiritensis]|uniref:hypothetical protein n=1 Tax=Legionella spiritensis TaxID=452 RepID=UPI000F6EAB72|nr:hypothetical protein [Legionella spiritensis]VEG91807.1 Uncharacterised protein [Legionella spiritensis]